MPRLEFIKTDILQHRDELLALNIEYLTWVFDGIERFFGVSLEVPAADYVPTVIDQICADPSGIFYLLKLDGALAGMGGWRLLRPGVAEIKRLYVRPAYRGRKLGELILERLLADTATCPRICLDSAPFMRTAHQLYANYGFLDCAAYSETEVPAEFHAQWRFMLREK